jgi:hypothetical protein
MSKKTQKKNRKMKRKTLRSKKTIKRFKKYKKGGNNEKVNCCMCEREVDKNNTLIPRACLIEHGISAHRICNDCWWNPESGFAREVRSDHKCPGCVKNLPLTVVNKEQGVIDLISDDE